MQLFKVHGYCFKNSVFYKEKKVPNHWEASTEGLKSIFNAKRIFKHFSRGLQGVGDLLFFIKHEIYRAVYMYFSNNCMHAPYIVACTMVFFEEKSAIYS